MTDQTNMANDQTGQDNSDTQQTCPNCGMPHDQWRGNNGQGFQIGNETYCCQGCADGTGCTCV